MAERRAIAPRPKHLVARLAANETEQETLWLQLAERHARGLAVNRIEHELTDSDRQMQALGAQRRRYGADIEGALSTSAARETERGVARRQLADKAAAAEAAYVSLRDELAARLEEDDAYRRAVAGHEAARQMLQALQLRLTQARADYRAQCEAYDNDALFVHLLGRGYPRPRDSHRGWRDRIDDWIARIVGFDAAFADYSLLRDMPAWLEENIAKVSAQLETHAGTLTRHRDAMNNTGELRMRRERAADTWQALENLEAAHAREREREQALIAARPDFLARRDRYAQELCAAYRSRFEQEPIAVLRQFAARSARVEDRAIVDELIDKLDELQSEHSALTQWLRSLRCDDADPA